MGIYAEQLECLHCSHSRNFVLHGEREQRVVGQAEAVKIGRHAVLTCGRCGSSSIIRSWADGLPYAAPGIEPRRRRRAQPTDQARDC